MPKRKPPEEHVIRVVLKAPREAAPLLIFARAVHGGMSEHATTFTKPDPSLLELQALIDDLHAKQVAMEHGGLGVAAKRDLALKALRAGLMKERVYVEMVCLADPKNAATIAAWAMMRLRAHAVSEKTDFELRPGPLSGTVAAIVKALEKAVSYEWRHRIKGTTDWTTAPTTLQADTVLTDLTPGTTIEVQFRALLRHSILVDWSRTETIIVV
jgi:hypothetical protein